MNKNRVAVFFVLMLSCGAFLFFLYSLTIRMSILLFEREAVAEVIEWTKKDDKTYVIYRYMNLVDNHSYTIEKEISKRSIDDLMGKKDFKIKYSTIFPSFTLIDGISDYSYVLLLIGCAIVAFVAYRSIQALRRKIPMSEFT